MINHLQNSFLSQFQVYLIEQYIRKLCQLPQYLKQPYFRWNFYSTTFKKILWIQVETKKINYLRSNIMKQIILLVDSESKLQPASAESEDPKLKSLYVQRWDLFDDILVSMKLEGLALTLYQKILLGLDPTNLEKHIKTASLCLISYHKLTHGIRNKNIHLIWESVFQESIPKNQKLKNIVRKKRTVLQPYKVKKYREYLMQQ